jgi:tetratricopeptide (TPR) repeat protein
VSRGAPLLQGRGRRQAAAAALGVFALAAVCFLPALRNGFVYDDAPYILQNDQVRAGLTVAGARWAFTSFHAANWHPLTWLTHMADVSLFGLEPAGHHLTSVLLHALNALALFLFLLGSTGKIGRSLAVAALFAAHPQRVDSVAWVAERKDVLCAFFFLATLACYLAYLRRPALWRYLGVLLFAALSLMAKPMAVTLPCVLLLLDWWPFGRLGRRATPGDPGAPLGGPWLEKVPLLLLAGVSAGLTVAAQSGGGAVQDLVRYTFPARLGNALWSYVAYLGHAIFPARLAALYPHLRENLPWWQPAVAAAILLAVTVWALKRRQPYLAVGWFWYLGMLVPVIGLVQVGGQAMADRYTYLPVIGVTLAAVWAAADAAAGRFRPGILAGAALLLTLASGAATWAYIPYWKNDLTLWQRTRTVTVDNSIAEANLGVALAGQGRLADALPHYREALRIEPRLADTWNNLGLAQSKSGALAEAVASFRRSIELKPGNAGAWNNLGVVQGKLGRWQEAAAAYEKVIALQPASGMAYYNLGLACLSLNDRARAQRVLQDLLRVDRTWAAKLAPFVGSSGD